MHEQQGPVMEGVASGLVNRNARECHEGAKANSTQGWQPVRTLEQVLRAGGEEAADAEGVVRAPAGGADEHEEGPLQQQQPVTVQQQQCTRRQEAHQH